METAMDTFAHAERRQVGGDSESEPSAAREAPVPAEKVKAAGPIKKAKRAKKKTWHQLLAQFRSRIRSERDGDELFGMMLDLQGLPDLLGARWMFPCRKPHEHSCYTLNISVPQLKINGVDFVARIPFCDNISCEDYCGVREKVFLGDLVKLTYASCNKTHFDMEEMRKRQQEIIKNNLKVLGLSSKAQKASESES